VWTPLTHPSLEPVGCELHVDISAMTTVALPTATERPHCGRERSHEAIHELVLPRPLHLPANTHTFTSAGIKGVWSVRSSWMDAFDSHLVLSFVGETRLLAISEEDVLDEAVIPGFDGDSQTLLAATTLHDHLLQVCGRGARGGGLNGALHLGLRCVCGPTRAGGGGASPDVRVGEVFCYCLTTSTRAGWCPPLTACCRQDIRIIDGHGEGGAAVW
jgi:hypothetical protein